MSRKTRRKQQNKQRVSFIQSGELTRALAATPVTAPTTNPTPGPATAVNPGTTNNPDFYQTTPPPLRGGRQTQPTNVNPLGMVAYAFLPRRQYQDIDLNDLTSLGNQITAQQLLEMFADLSPEVSLALWNTVQLVNTGYKYQVKSKDGKRDLSRAKATLDELVDGLNKDGGGIDAVIDSLTITAFLQGAVSGELALTEDLQDVIDLYAVQPWSIYFERDGNQNLVPFQSQTIMLSNPAQGYGTGGYPFKRLNPVTFGYIPIHAAPDDPYGRPPAAPVLQLIAFDLQLLKDIRQSVHANAWGRIDISIIEETLLKNAPSFTADPSGQKKRQWVANQITAFKESYDQIKPDDAFIHSDAVKVTSIDSSGKTFQIDAIVRMLERRLIRSLKQLPVLMGSNEGTTETHGTVQMDIYAAGIKSLQKTIANLLEKLLGVALQVYGISAKVVWEFEPVRATDRLADAQAEMVESQLSAYQRDQGWITQDEASIKLTGSEAVAEPKVAQLLPPVMPATDANTTKDNKPDPKAKVDANSGDTEGEGVDAGNGDGEDKKAA
jgi:hypothetical protein